MPISQITSVNLGGSLNALIKSYTLSILNIVNWSGDKKAGPFIENVFQICKNKDQVGLTNELVKFISSRDLELKDKQILLKAICQSFSEGIIDPHSLAILTESIGISVHYSQEGEDLLLERIFSECRSGFFIDVGAHHPTRFSNTYLLYTKGWNGINLDAMPGSMKAFDLIRPNDKNLEIAISDRLRPVTFYAFREPALNTFSKDLADEYIKSGHKLNQTFEIESRRLDMVLDDHLRAGQKIDLLSVDVEGDDLAVLRSNNWKKYRPEVVIIEVLNSQLNDLEENLAVQFLEEHNYYPVHKLINSVIFRSR